MLNVPDSSPFALTEHVLHTHLFHHTLSYWLINGAVAGGAVLAGIWVARKAFNAALGKQN